MTRVTSNQRSQFEEIEITQRGTSTRVDVHPDSVQMSNYFLSTPPTLLLRFEKMSGGGMIWCLLVSCYFLGSSAGSWEAVTVAPKAWVARSRISQTSRESAAHVASPLVQHISRGGAQEDNEERYSRQVYTLGARAHGLVRSATVYVDGPSTSGLLYEAVKNLALSGIGKLVLVTSEESLDENYHFFGLDDLGQTYVRGARAELGLDDDDTTSSTEILIEFLHRLNPVLQVQTVKREELDQKHESSGILLCVDRPYKTQLSLNKLCRKMAYPFVAVETAGVYGRTFSDFGPTFEVHDLDGEAVLAVPLDRVELEDKARRTILVRSVEGERHDVSKGDEIQFQMSNGDVMELSCIVSQVRTPERVVMEIPSTGIDVDKFIEEVNGMASTFSRKKKLEEISFVSLEDATSNVAVDSTLFTPSDLDKSFDETRKGAVFSSFQALSAFVLEHERLPNSGDCSSFNAMTKDAWPDVDHDAAWMKHCQLFATKCAAKFVPLQAMFGAIGAQECLKAASGLYNPIHQFLLYDCDEVVPSLGDDDASEECAHSGMAYIMGEEVDTAFKSQKLFVVGSGAIGCEILKNLAAMGAGTTKTGVIIITDMDTIEQSNLSRQLLFRDGDISKFKSKAAEEAVARLNPSIKMECHTSKVGDDELGPFDSRFWLKKVDIVLNALDNMDARLYIDAQCVANQKALIDAGTLGSKGNVQVVIPNQSESYGSSADPPDRAIPVCTLKNFPYAISHTIQWGRDLFDGLFVRRPKQANQYAETLVFSGLKELEATLEHDMGDLSVKVAARELSEDLSVMVDPSDLLKVKDNAIAWAIKLSQDYFQRSVEKLLKEHPADSLDEDDEPFWSGSRKTPTALMYVEGNAVGSHQKIVNNNVVDFVRHAARLRIETYLGTMSDSLVTIEEANTALQQSRASALSVPHEKESTSSLLQRLVSFSNTTQDLESAEFEKDDDSNGHVAFITAASNLRAICYGIPPVDAMETRRVAGRIVPAMITTTAFVSALSCIELLKLVQQAPLRRHRNAFINLALPFFAFTAPLPAEEVEGLRGQTHTLWDRITIKESKKVALSGGLTLRKLLKRLKKKVSNEPDSVEISSISYGQYMIYASFLNDEKDDLLDMNLWAVVRDAVESGNNFDAEFSRSSDLYVGSSQVVDTGSLDLTVVVEDLRTGEEAELPPVRVARTKYSKDS